MCLPSTGQCCTPNPSVCYDNTTNQALVNTSITCGATIVGHNNCYRSCTVVGTQCSDPNLPYCTGSACVECLNSPLMFQCDANNHQGRVCNGNNLWQSWSACDPESTCFCLNTYLPCVQNICGLPRNATLTTTASGQTVTLSGSYNQQGGVLRAYRNTTLIQDGVGCSTGFGPLPIQTRCPFTITDTPPAGTYVYNITVSWLSDPSVTPALPASSVTRTSTPITILACTDTCTSKGYQCGIQTICGNQEDCGACTSGVCSPTGQCVACNTDADCATQTCKSVACVNSNCQYTNLQDATSCDTNHYCFSGTCTSVSMSIQSMSVEAGNQLTITPQLSTTPATSFTRLFTSTGTLFSIYPFSA